MIKEAFLHFVWQNQYFNKTKIFTQSGEPIQIQKVGFHNHLAGPDFSEAEVVIGGISGLVQLKSISAHQTGINISTKATKTMIMSFSMSFMTMTER